jgi:Ca2+-binding RTX toxin-like protein
MSLLKFASLSISEIVDVARLANASYGEAVPVGWRALTGGEINFSPGFLGPLAGGIMEQNSTFFTTGAQYSLVFGFDPSFSGMAQVYRSGDRLAISFRGTDKAPTNDSKVPDFSEYPELVSPFYSFSYIRGFEKFLESIASYAASRGISGSNVLVTGHSLGGGAANQLRQFSEDVAEGYFSNSTYIGFASPKIVETSNVFNFGFDNDWVFKRASSIIDGNTPFLSSTDNILFVQSNISSFAGSALSEGLGGADHSMENYILALRRISQSPTYSLTNRDSFVAIASDDSTALQNDLFATQISRYIGLSTPIVYLGNANANLIVAGTGSDTIDAGDEADTVLGNDGADRVWGGTGNDDLRGDAGTDDLRGEGGADTIRGGTENDTLYGGTENDSLLGDGGDDHLKGERDNDTLLGDAGRDSLYGDEHNDYLFGGAASDLIEGGDGMDTAAFVAGAGGVVSFRREAGGDVIVSSTIDGTDRLRGVEYVSLSGTTRSIDEWIALLYPTPAAPVGSGRPPPDTLQPPPDPNAPTPPSGSVNYALSVTRKDITLAPGVSAKLTDIYDPSGWRDGVGAQDLTWFAVQDRSAGGGILTLDGSPLQAGVVYEARIADIGRYGFTSATSSAVDEIGFNVIQLDGDYSPSFAVGAAARVTTQAASGGGTGGVVNPGNGPTEGGKADLVPVITEVSATQFAPGGILTVRFTLNNVGQTSALITNTGVFLSPDSNITLGDTLIGTVSPGTIVAGGSASGRIDYVIPDSFVGTFQVGVWADYTQRWTENVESNNIATQAVTIGAPAASQADLEFRQAYLTKTQVLFGETIALDASVRNSGDAASARTDVRVYLSTNTLLQPDRDVWLTQNQISEILPGRGRSAYSEFSVRLADVLAAGGTGQPQNLFLITVIDEDRSVADRDRSDNLIVRRITIADAPGNWIGYSDNVAYDLILSDDTYGAGDQLQFTVKLKNQGTIDIQDAPGFGRIADLVWRSAETGAERLLGSSRVDDNYVKGQEFLTFGRWFLDGTELSPGYYDVFARVRTDAAEPVDLRANNESNAVRVFFGSEDQRRLVEMSDLSVEALTITRGATGALSATATIANKGGLAIAAGTTAALYVERTDGSGGFQIVKSVALGAFGAAAGGAPVTATLAFTNVDVPYLAPGEYRAGLLLDIFDVVDEAKAGNNVRDGLIFLSDGTAQRTGTAAAELFDGGPGNDTISGLGGDDTLEGGGGSDWLYGGTDDDWLAGGFGDDTLDGGLGIDWASYASATAAVTVNLDAASSSGSHGIDDLMGIEAVLGGGGDDSLLGNAGSNTLHGGAGADTMAGGSGNDLFFVTDAGDLVMELAGGGADTIIASNSMAMPNQVETVLIATGVSGITITGGAGNDMLTGNGLANSFNGGAGDDVILAGNVRLADIYALFAN